MPKNIITRSLGPHPHGASRSRRPVSARGGRYVLAVQRRAERPAGDRAIGTILASLAPEEAAQTLVDLANLRGGPDNITVIVVDVATKAKLGEGSQRVDGGPLR